MSRTVTYGNIKYNCKTLETYTVGRINWKTDEKIIEQWGLLIRQYFDLNNLEDEVVVKLGRIIESEIPGKHDITILTKRRMEELDRLMIGTVPGERIVCYYQVFEPLKFRQIKINKILDNG